MRQCPRPGGASHRSRTGRAGPWTGTLDTKKPAGWVSSAVTGLNRRGVAHVTDRQDERRARSGWWEHAALFVRADRACHQRHAFINGRGEHCVRGHAETGKLSPGGGN
jgi:hypothetical protein